ncbi:MAG: DUF1579 family protein [Planctomycetota bacterium]|jgi:hypothetical protein
MTTQTDMDACVATATPGEAHKLLEPFAGTWKAEVKSWMEPGSEPQVSTGTMVNTPPARPIPDRRPTPARPAAAGRG